MSHCLILALGCVGEIPKVKNLCISPKLNLIYGWLNEEKIVSTFALSLCVRSDLKRLNFTDICWI